MNTENMLRLYVRKAREQGYSDSEIRGRLMSAGWHPKDVYSVLPIEEQRTKAAVGGAVITIIAALLVISFIGSYITGAGFSIMPINESAEIVEPIEEPVEEVEEPLEEEPVIEEPIFSIPEPIEEPEDIEEEPSANETLTEEPTLETSSFKVMAAPTTYYVNASGDDDNDGLTEGTAWRNITYAATQATTPGDHVYIKAGNYGHEHVVIQASGNSSHPIIFEGYDTIPGDAPTNKSNMPELNGSDREGIGFTAIGKSYIILKHMYLQLYEIGISFISESEHCEFRYIIMDDMGLAGDTIGEGIRVISSNYTTIDHCTLTDTGYKGVTFEKSSYSNCTNTNVYGVSNNPDYTYQYYIHIGSSSYCIIDGCNVEQTTLPGVVGLGIFMDGADEANPSHDNLVKNCTSNVGGVEYLFAGNQTYDNTIQDSSTTIETSIFLMARQGARDNIFERMTCITNPAHRGIGLGMDTVKPGNGAYNITVRNSIMKTFHAAMWLTMGEAEDNVIEESTFIDIGGGDSMIYDYENGGTHGTNTFKNCIFQDYSVLSGNGTIMGGGAGGTGTENISYSDFYDCDFALPNGTGNINANPLFADPANDDYHLNSTHGRWNGTGWQNDSVHSPCIDSGDPLDDYSAESAPNGSRINMGRYGNTSEASKSNITAGDVTPPLITITYPSNNSYINGTWLNITGTASDDNTDTVWTNSSNFSTMTGSYASWNFTNTTPLAGGVYFINITANDSAGNTNSTYLWFNFTYTVAGNINGTFTWTNAGGDGIWENAANWDLADYPKDNKDIALFNGTNNSDCNTIGAITVGELLLDTGYTGTITLGSNLTVDDAGGQNGQITITSGTLKSITPGTTITGNAAQTMSVYGTLEFTGTPGNNVVITDSKEVVLYDGSTADLQNVNITNNNAGYSSLQIGSSGLGAITDTQLDNLTLTNANANGNALLVAVTTAVEVTNSTFSGGTATNFETTDLQMWTNAKVELDTCTFTTVSLRQTGGWIVSKDHNGVANEWRYWGVMNTNATDAEYNATTWTSSTNVEIENADAYSTAFNSSISLNEDGVVVNNITVNENTTLNINGNVTSQGYLNISTGTVNISNGSLNNFTITNMNNTRAWIHNATDVQLYSWDTLPAGANINITTVAVNVSNFTAKGYMDLNISYTTGDVADFNASNLKIYRWDGTNWTVESDTGVNVPENYTWAKGITSFSAFAIGEKVLGGGGGGDVIPPLIDVTEPANNSEKSWTINVTINGTASDETALGYVWINDTRFTWNNTNTSWKFKNNTAIKDGVLFLTITANDSAGNQNSTYLNITIDTKVPLIDVTAPANNSYKSWKINATINGTASDNNTDTISVNDTRFIWNNNYASWKLKNNTVLADNVIFLTITANDSAGNSNSTIFNFTLDTKEPKIDVTEPANNSIKAWTVNVTINGTASDNYTDTISVNDTRFTWNSTYDSWKFKNNTAIADRVYLLQITANDSAGNTNTTTVIFTIDTTPPKITVIEPANNSEKYWRINVTINGTATETYEDTVWINDTRFSWNNTYSSWKFKNNTAIANGVVFLNISANDTLGNQNSTYWNFSITAAAEEEETQATDNVGAPASMGEPAGFPSSISEGVSVDKMKAGEPILFDIVDENIAVINVELTLNEDLENVAVMATSLGSNPGITPPRKIIYKYLVISAPAITGSAIDSASISFAVDVNWIRDNKIIRGTIVLERYVDNKWVPLTTIMNSETENRLTFKSATPSFGYFVIRGDSELPVEEVKVKEQIGKEEEALYESLAGSVAKYFNREIKFNSKSMISIILFLIAIAVSIKLYIRHKKICKRI